MFSINNKNKGFLTLSPQAEQLKERINVWKPFIYKLELSISQPFTSTPSTQREVFRLFHTFQKCSKNAVFMLV